MNAVLTQKSATARKRAIEPRALPIRFHRPLVNLWTALTLIGGDRPEDIIKLIEDGHLRWAFDVSSRSSATREIRVLGASINEFLGAPVAPTVSEQDNFEAAMKLIFPTQEWAMPACRIACAWNISPDQVLNLCRTKPRELNLVKGKPGRARPGRGGSPLVEVGSAIAFLRRRQVL